MRRTRRVPGTRRAVALSLLASLALAGVAPSPGRADHGMGEDLKAVMDVVKLTEAEARAGLATQGFLVARFEVAGEPEGTVAAQSPVAGTLLSLGGAVRIDVRVKGAASVAPDLVGKGVADAVRAAGEQFVPTATAVAGEAKDKGKVVRQTPAAGQPLDVRGTLALEYVADDAAPAKVPMPNLLGLSAADAVASLVAAGFLPRVSRTSIEYVPADIVVSQAPAAGTETAAYAWADVVATVEPPVAEPPAVARTTVPNVVSLTESAARAEVERAGLLAKIEKVEGDAASAFLVLAQDPGAGASVELGTEVRLSVVDYRPPEVVTPAKVAVPSLIGMSQWQAEDLLVSLKLIPNPIPTEVADVPPLRVFSQQSAPGTEVDEGTQVTFRVATAPPPPTNVAVPNFFGRTKNAAIALASQAGVAVDPQWVEDGTKPANLVFSQSIAAGILVAPGTVVAVLIAKHPAGPAMATVPNLIGMTEGQASVALAGVGLAGSPSFVYAPAKPVLRVFEQGVAAGTSIVSGSVVPFKVAKLPDLVGVPAVVGKTKAQAQAILGGLGFTVDVTYKFPGGKPFLTVLAQNPSPGTALVVGSNVHLDVAGIPDIVIPLKVHVPNVQGKSFEAAKAAIEAAGLVPHGSKVVALGKPMHKVFWQDPAGGTLLAKGSQVSYRVAIPFNLPGPIDALFVHVPNLIGLTPVQAHAALAAKGLSSDGKIDFKFGKPPHKVYSQSPGAGSPVLKGSTVKWKANP